MNTIQYPKNYVAWDLETSGLSGSQNKILEIGAMVVRDGEIQETHSWLLNNQIEISEEITGITGIDKALIDAEGRDPKECLDEFFQVLKTKEPHLTHNGIRFDIPFLAEQTLQIYGISFEKHQQLIGDLYRSSIDTAALMKAKKLGLVRNWNESFKDFADRTMEIRAFGVKYNVAICCEDLGIDKTGIQQHRALGDVELTKLIYDRLIFPMP